MFQHNITAKNGAMKVNLSNITQTTLKHAKSIILDSAIEHWQKSGISRQQKLI